ncbi:MAG: LacI family DNA-binding transcriptional regulator [Verrucomicrobia bacterium]|nr:LacI family DNA-binding transcriptional regulator [Verrucomicrobiota bacterium]
MPPAATPNPARVSLRDVARVMGVSHVTVSLALRDDPRVSAARREEVKATAEKLGYRPDPMLASLSAYRHSKRPVTIHSTIAWLNQWPDPKALRRLQEFAAYWRGAQEAATSLGYRLEEFVLDREMTGERLQRILTTRNVRGILLPPHVHGFSLPGFDWAQCSVVRFGVSVKEPRAHVITCDQMNCASLAFMKIRERGYRRIGYVTSRGHDRNTGGNFRAGYLAIQDATLPLPEHLEPLLLEERDARLDERALKPWLRRWKPDAIITTDARLHAMLTDLGIEVPRDLAAAALSVLDGDFDAGVDQNSLEIGQVAMRTLAGLIHQNERGVPRYCRRILVEGRWVDGASLPAAKPATRPVARG